MKDSNVLISIDTGDRKTYFSSIMKIIERPLDNDIFHYDYGLNHISPSQPSPHSPYWPSSDRNIFIEAGTRGGEKSKKHNQFRRTIIAQLIQGILYKQPLNLKLSSTYVANEIHDDFECEVAKDCNKYGAIDSFGARDKRIGKPFIDYLVKTIRSMCKSGLKLIKSCANNWYPYPGFIFS